MADNIFIDGRLLSNTPTGISRYSHQLIQAFRKKYGNEKVFVIVNPGYSCTEDYNFIFTKLKPYNPFHYIVFSFFVNKHDYLIYYSPFYSGIYFKTKKRKQVITVHDLMFQKITNYFSALSFFNATLKFIFNILVRLTLRSSDLVISVSETTKRDLQELFKRDAVVIGEGVNELENTAGMDFLSLPAPIQEKIEGNKYFLYVGNFRKQKNVPFLIEAFLKSNTPHKLVLAGDYHSNSRTISADHGKIIYTGTLTDAEIYSLYKNCEAFIMPSLYEGFGLPILEAYCAGARVFTSNQGALMEFKDMNIHYFSPYNINGLISLIQNADNVTKPTDFQIYAAKKRYSWQRQTDKILQCIENLN